MRGWQEAVAAVLDERFYTMSWLLTRIKTGDARLWLAHDATIITEVRTYPTGAQDLHGLVAAGALETIVGTLIPQAEAWAKAQGCVGAIIESREGWQRVLSSFGYQPYQVAVRKEL